MRLPEGWKEIDGRLMCEFEFGDFEQAKNFVDQISQLFRVHNHHADVHFGWGYVILELMTHDQQAITELDLNLADAINELR